jgi:hypothetical protein
MSRVGRSYIMAHAHPNSESVSMIIQISSCG